MGFGVCRSVIVKNILYSNFRTTFSDVDTSLTMKTSIFQSLNTDEGHRLQEEKASFGFLRMSELRNFITNLQVLKETFFFFFFFLTLKI